MPESPLSARHIRVQRSRYVALASRVGIDLQLLFAAIIAVFGSLLIVQGKPIGWSLVGLSLLGFAIARWLHYAVGTNPPLVTGDRPEDLLSQGLLVKIGRRPMTPQTMTAAIQSLEGQRFFELRFGLSSAVLDQMASQAAPDWWNRVVDLYRQYPLPGGVGAEHICVGLLQSMADKQTLLTHINYTETEVLGGLAWFKYISDTMADLRTRTAKGGIARDWAVGYTPQLTRYTHNISYELQYGTLFHRDVFGRSEVMQQIHGALDGAGRRNILLVGDDGVGRSTCVQAYAEKLLFDASFARSLQYFQIHQVDIVGLMSQLTSKAALEQVVTAMCVEAYKAKNIILYFPDLTNLFGVEGGIDLSDTLQPIVQSGRVRMIFSTTPGRLQWLRQTKPALAALLNQQTITPPAAEDTLRILESHALRIENQYGCLFTYGAIKQVYTLAERYGPELAMPGRATNVLETAARINTGQLIDSSLVTSAIEKTTGIKIATASSDEKSLLLQLDELLHSYVVGQEQAIASLVSALQRSRSGVSGGDKPIGTFLFLGPTGVGKTETAKAIARTYFGGEDHMIRVDMNEYVTENSLERFLASGSASSDTLLDTIRKQPFSVVLFDELEKAHPKVVNSLLQLLDEGVMRDHSNKAISFKDAIIIATSNAGAERLMTGEAGSFTQNEFVNHLITDGIFKPEFLNRFDDIIIYQPLTKEQLLRVVDLQLTKINQNIASKQLVVGLTDGAKVWLAANGYDPKMGARPLRRLMQSTVERALSVKILQDNTQPGTTITLDQSDLEPYLS